MSEFKDYRRSQIAEIREVTEKDIDIFNNHGFIHISEYPFGYNISISNADKNNGSPKIGDMIARNPKDYADQWLVAEQYFNDNFEEVNSGNTIQKCNLLPSELLKQRDEMLEMLKESIRVLRSVQSPRTPSLIISEKIEQLITRSTL